MRTYFTTFSCLITRHHAAYIAPSSSPTSISLTNPLTSPSSSISHLSSHELISSCHLITIFISIYPKVITGISSTSIFITNLISSHFIAKLKLLSRYITIRNLPCLTIIAQCFIIGQILFHCWLSCTLLSKINSCNSYVSASTNA